MNAEVLIKARKVFVKEPVEYSETCLYCSSKGIHNKLRYYYISLKEAIYKCASPTCLYPFQRFIFKCLTDNSVYYYEEVLDRGREAIFRVSLDNQPMYQSQNPLCTKEFCDNQRNPKIEDYSCDFSDLLGDFEPELEHQPESDTSASINPDFLEFLDDIVPVTDHPNVDKVPNENGVASIIDNLLKESTVKNSTQIKRVKEISKKSKGATNKLKPEANLFKCIKHIEKFKIYKKTRDKSAETFSMAIQKARKSQTKVEIEATSPVKTKPIREQMQPKLHVLATKQLSTALKSANTLRPTALAKQLSSINFTNINSAFLREFMKAKEDKLFEDEPSNMDNENNTVEQKGIVERINAQQTSRRNNSSAICETMTNTSLIVNETLKPTKTLSLSRKVNKKEHSIECKCEKSEISLKKEGIPRLLKLKCTHMDVKEEKLEKWSNLANLVVPKQEPENQTQEKSQQKRSSNRKKRIVVDTICSESKHPVKKKFRHQKSSTDTNENLTTETDTKSKWHTSAKKIKNDASVTFEEKGPKPQKSRRSINSTKANSNKNDLPSLPTILANFIESEPISVEKDLNPNFASKALRQIHPPTSNSISTIEDRQNSSLNQKCINPVTLHFDDESGSSQMEPLFGFIGPSKVENEKEHIVFVNTALDTTCLTQKPTKRRKIDKKPNETTVIKFGPKNDSNENGSSKQPRIRNASSQLKSENQDKRKKTSKSRKKTLVKSKIGMISTELPALSGSGETKQNVQHDISSLNGIGKPFTKDSSMTDVPRNVSTEANEQNEESYLKKSLKLKRKTSELIPYQSKMKKITSNVVEDIIFDWNDEEDRKMMNENVPNIQTEAENQVVDDTSSVITIVSETSDCSVAFYSEI